MCYRIDGGATDIIGSEPTISVHSQGRICMAILIEQKFPRDTFTGKMLPLNTKPIVVGKHRLGSQRSLELLLKLRPEEIPEEFRGMSPEEIIRLVQDEE